MFRCENDGTNCQKSSARFGRQVLMSIHQARIKKGFEAEREPKRDVAVRPQTMHCHVGLPVSPNLLQVGRPFFPYPRSRSHDATRYRSPKDFPSADFLLWCHREEWRPA